MIFPKENPPAQTNWISGIFSAIFTKSNTPLRTWSCPAQTTVNLSSRPYFVRSFFFSSGDTGWNTSDDTKFGIYVTFSFGTP